MIIERTRVLEAYKRAVELGSDHAQACASVAQAMHITTEMVEDIAWAEIQVPSEMSE